MPYIKPQKRKLYDKCIDELAEKVSTECVDNCEQFCGDWNYIVTKLIKKTLEFENCQRSYSQFNEIIGMLECCKLEIFRRFIAPYEDEKIGKNGDV